MNNKYISSNNIFNELVALGALDRLKSLGIEYQQAENLENILQHLGVIEKYIPLLKALVLKLREEGFIEYRSGAIHIAHAYKATLESSQWMRDLTRVATERNEMQAHVALLKTCLDAFIPIVTGKVTATDVIFSEDADEPLSGIFNNHVEADYISKILHTFVSGTLKNSIPHLTSDEQLTILEIGTGSADIRELIQRIQEEFDAELDYSYAHASFQGYAGHPSAAKTINLELQPDHQGFETNSYDLIIVNQALFGVRDISRSLSHIKTLLKADGILVLNEPTRSTLFTMSTIGLLVDWSSEAWSYFLHSTGFNDITEYPEGKMLFQQVVVGQSDGMVLLEYNERSVVEEIDDQFTITETQNTEAPEAKNGTAEIFLRKELGKILKMEPEKFDAKASMSDYGIDSILGLKLVKAINKALNITVPTTILFDYPTIEELVAYLIDHHEIQFKASEKNVSSQSNQNDVPLNTTRVREETVAPSNKEPSNRVIATDSSKHHNIDTIDEKTPDYEITPNRGLRLWLDQPDTIDNIQLTSFTPDAPGFGEVLVAIESFSLNFGDLLCVKGLYPTMPPYPFSPGFEAAGRILALGEGVTGRSVGDPVIILADDQCGLHSSHKIVKNSELLSIPEQMPLNEACTWPIVGMTVVEIFRRASFRKGNSILIQTATGGVGLLLVQMALHHGLQVIATAGSEEKLEYLRNRGVEHVINYQTQDFEQEVKKITKGQGVAVVINTLGGGNIQKGINCLDKRGQYIELSMTAIKSMRQLDMTSFSNNQSFITIDLRRLFKEDFSYALDLWEECTQWIKKGVLKATISTDFELSDYKQAYKLLENRGNIGKVVVNVRHQQAAGSSSSHYDVTVKESKSMDIAIVGMSGQYGKADDLQEFWEYLKSGESLIEEVPHDRWSISQYYDPDKEATGKTYCKWGSFMRGIYEFDPFFFRLSGKEAKHMDPQQRLFLMHCWHALEDASIVPSTLSKSRCGVFVGATNGDYLWHIDKADASVFWGNTSSILASRIAYYLNLKGPALAVDTACSSSLVAIDMACRSLVQNETDMALSGGITINHTPRFYQLASKANMLSPEGQCYTFDHRANGFVPGEGVGVVVLKRLADAERDGDPIIGVIKGSASNQDGTTNGILAPSAKSQEELETYVYQKYGIDPETISYVEAHGTGTNLGDPIEFNALSQAFRQSTDKKQFCALGSVKTNVGHTLMAAGVAGLQKVLLGMKYRMIPPSLNLQKINPLLDIEGSPFYINDNLINWDADVRRAAVSSFGFSGTNAHVVVESYTQERENHEDRSPALIVLSAKNKERLRAVVSNLLNHLEENPHLPLPNVAYTLQMGREAFEERLAFTANDLSDFSKKLNAYLSDELQDIFTGNIETNTSQQKPEQSVIDYAIKSKDITSLGQWWVIGTPIDWSSLYPKPNLGKVSLPPYPFEKDTYYLKDEQPDDHKNIGLTQKLHPLLHVNESHLKAQQFKSVFSGEEKFFADHVVKGEKILPGVAYLEMARTAGAISTRENVAQLKDVYWLSPLSVGPTSREVITTIFLKDNDLHYEVYSIAAEQKQVHSQGKIVNTVEKQPSAFDLEGIKLSLSQTQKSCYATFKEIGLHYGPSFQGIKKLWYSGTEVLSQIALPQEAAYEWAPGVIDSSLQTALVLLMEHTGTKLSLPFSVKEVNSFKPLTSTLWCYAERNSREIADDVHSYNINLLNGSGEVLMNLKGVEVLPLNGTFDHSHPTQLTWKDTDSHASQSNGEEQEQFIQEEASTLTQHKANAQAHGDLRKKVTKKLLTEVADLLDMNVQRLQKHKDLGDYGFDSLLLTKLTNTLNKFYGLDLVPTLLYNYSSIERLAAYLLKEHESAVAEKHLESAPCENNPVDGEEQNDDRDEELNSKVDFSSLQRSTEAEEMQDIAIVGMSGRFPGSPDLETFWENIRNNEDLITEIPASRWDWKAYYGNPIKERHKTKAKWGGFIQDIDKFDSLFFSISPQEAELMDPQQRIAVEATYHAFEDAGLAPNDVRGSNTGVFFGVSTHDYMQMIDKYSEQYSDGRFLTGTVHSILANRISYLFDLHGPSEPVNTACSSALIAIHHAVTSINKGYCDMAVAGGVNALLAPEVTLSSSQAGMLSDDGRCKTFDQAANGYVRGEGVGVVVLKPLAQAEADGDHIYGVIAGTAENHGGKANTLTSPNPIAQRDLLLKAYRSAKIDPRNVSYIEAHGTGTSLGDPIETEGLKLAFQTLFEENGVSPPKTPYCGVGSVKTNIGHLEAGAGVAGLIKVLLALKHKMLPGNVHLKNPNEYLKLEKTPLYLLKETRKWETVNGHPRIAGISSFGFGGSNAHVIVKEYISKRNQVYNPHHPALIVLSAWNKDRLRAKVAELHEYLGTNSDLNVHDIAYTLQVGRDHMAERLAFLADNIATLINLLYQFLDGDDTGLLTGNIRENLNGAAEFDDRNSDHWGSLFSEGQLETIARHWVAGAEINWRLLYETTESLPNKVKLPLYPFARKRHWISDLKAFRSKDEHHLHPLVHEKNPNTKGHFICKFSGEEDFFVDHKVRGLKILPGVAYLEMAVAAFGADTSAPVTQIRNVTWLKPIEANQNLLDVHIALQKDKELIRYKIYNSSSQAEVIHGQGNIYTHTVTAPAKRDIAKIMSSMVEVRQKNETYELFKALGLDYGPGFQGIKQLFYSEAEALSEIDLKLQDNYSLQPGLLDCALQTCLGLNLSDHDKGLSLPFGIKEVSIYGDAGQTKWCYARKSQFGRSGSSASVYDIDMLSEQGEVLVQINGFTSIPVPDHLKQESTAAPEREGASGVELFTYRWRDEQLVPNAPADAEHITVLAKPYTGSFAEKARHALQGEVIISEADTSIDFYKHVQNVVQSVMDRKKKTWLTVIYPVSDQLDFGLVSGLLKTAHLENPKVYGKTLGLEDLSATNWDDQIYIIKSERADEANEVRYIQGARQVRAVELLSEGNMINPKVPLKEGGVYLITGGAGGLGLIMARYISKVKGTRSILTGRSQTSKLSQAELNELNAVYHRCDVTDLEQVAALITTIKEAYGKLDGIIHSAGLIRDSFLFKKSAEESIAVLRPKIDGAKHLDETTADLDLDFIIYFSSVAAILGNVGQADYASANTWLDNHAAHRNTQVEKGNRKGKTLSINWPLWRDGGMQIGVDAEQYLEKKWGVVPLPTAQGLAAMEILMAQNISQGIVSYGDREKLINTFGINSMKESSMPDTIDNDKKLNAEIIRQIEDKVIAIIAELSKIDAEHIERQVDFAEYGVDSIMMMKILNALEEEFQITTDPTAVVNYPTIAQLAEYLYEETGGHSITVSHEQPLISLLKNQQRESIEADDLPEINQTNTPDKIAIIGISGCFPGSDSIDEFWHNLKNARDLISDVPKTRWNATDYYAEEGADDKSYTMKGGFVKDAGKFDAEYFNISDANAIGMDPQQRIVLELSRALLAHAGYEKDEMNNSNTCVYIGAKDNAYVRNNYHLLSEKARQHTVVNNISNMIAARVSDFYNLKGTSQTIDTACSSGLVAIHNACEAILQGNAEMAIAGGIFIMVDPFGHIGFSQAGVLSQDGKSYVFDERAQGFVMGEGGGLVLLKSYDQAIKDGDKIYGVIMGSAVNNDGKTMGLTVPNKDGQKEVIRQSLLKSGVDASQITYYEAHGTGTLLGDPIEVKAATEVYRSESAQLPFDQYCALGSVKSNMGHAMTAAGVAGLIKILLQLEHQTLVPTLNCQKPHPRFNFPESPFYPNTEVKTWEPASEGKRFAALSSFGFGGTNCHMIIGEGNNVNVRRKPLPVIPLSQKSYWLGERNHGPEKVDSKELDTAAPVDRVITTDNEDLIEAFLRDQLATILPNQDVSSKTNFMDLGVDSNQLISLVQKLEDALGHELYPTLFFEYQNIAELTEYLSEEYPEAFFVEEGVSPMVDIKKEVKQEYQEPSIKNDPGFHMKEAPFDFAKKHHGLGNEEDPIAIVGMHGVFPEARDVDTFWQHLYDKRELIKEIPKDHFDYTPWYSTDPSIIDKIYCKWGSFIDDVDKFDAGFFNISPREAEVMDPQLRYILQVVYGTAEDAGAIRTIRGTNTGLYVGVCYYDYRDRILEDVGEMDPHMGSGNAATMLANRPSFYFDFRGPSLVIDTACSSSLVALNEAAKAIAEGECDQAFAVGVNLLLGSPHYRHFCSIGGLSYSGRCHTFDQRADGFVPGESIGAVMLKPLSKAKQDGDQIYGIVKGGAIGHGGYTPSITAPSVDGEANVLKRAWDDAGINPHTIGYIEAHGTGTKLGDPIEINALKKALKAYPKREEAQGPYIGVGSAKAHIGHAEGAAGIIGVIKALLSLKYKTIPAMPQFDKLNPYIKLEGSPLYINTEPLSWENSQPHPRRVGVSSFGFGGAYAHVVLEEYEDNRPVTHVDGPAIVPISARNGERLKEAVANLVEFLDRQSSTITLHDLAYTLQSGREDMDERMAIVATDIGNLKDTLRKFLNEQENRAFVIGNVKKNKERFKLTGKAGEAFIKTAIQEKELEALTQLWVKGVSLDLTILYNQNQTPRKISLPTYPFAKESYWVAPATHIERTQDSLLHPLLHRNVSDLDGLKYQSTYSGKEFFLQDHQVNGEKVLPGVAYVELVRAAINLAKGEKVTRLQDIIWSNPLTVNGKPVEMQLRLQAEGELVNYTVYHEAEGQEVVYGTGKVMTSSVEKPAKYDIHSIQERLSETKSGEDCYAYFKNAGLIYGPSFQGITSLWYGKNESLSKIELSKKDGYGLQLGVLDSALQTCLGLTLDQKEKALSVPFNVKELNIYHDLPEVVWCYATKKADHTTADGTLHFDVVLLNDHGEALVSFNDLVVLPIQGISKNTEDQVELHRFNYEWVASSITGEPEVTGQHILLLSGATASLAESLSDALGIEVENIPLGSAEDYFAAVFEKVQSLISTQELLTIMVVGEMEQYHRFGFVSGLLKSISHENPKISAKVVVLPKLSAEDLPLVTQRLKLEQFSTDPEVRYIADKREVRELQEMSGPPAQEENGELSIKAGGTYLITGGMGGLGLIFARYIHEKGGSVILTGRGPLTDEREALLFPFDRAHYEQCDVADWIEVESLFRRIEQSFGRLDGVIHSAGVIKDGLTISKTLETAQSVLDPKIKGARHLAKAAEAYPVDFIIFFSSIAAVFGNIGQADYAAGNAFLDNYAGFLEQERLSGLRKGKVISINWPLWQEGMGVDPEIEQYMIRKSGMYPLPSQVGVDFFEEVLHSAYGQPVAIYGEGDRIKSNIFQHKEKTKVKSTSPAQAGVLINVVTEKILGIASELLKLDVSNIELDEELSDYGFDSIIIAKFGNELNAYYSLDLPPSLFFTHSTIEKLAEYLVSEHMDALADKHGMEELEIEGPAKDDRVEKAISDKVLVPGQRSALPDVPTLFPLSEGQKGLWFIQASEPASTIYNLPIAFTVKGTSNDHDLYSVAERLLEKHAILRTTFDVDKNSGELYQRLQTASEYLQRDIQPLASGQPIEEVFQELVLRPFDLSETAIRLHLQKDEHLDSTHVLFVFHHIVLDGASAMVFISDFLSLWDQHVKGIALGQDMEEDSTYFDFIRWESDHIQSKQGQADVDYWRAQLPKQILPLDMPYDPVENHDQKHVGEIGVQKIKLGGPSLDKLKATAKKLRVSTSVVTLAAFKTLLSRLCNMEDVTVTLPTLGRPKEAFGESIGYYINMMISHTHVNGSQRFVELVGHLNTAITSNLDHLRYPFPKLLTTLGLTKGGSAENLFPVSFIFQNFMGGTSANIDSQEIQFMEGIQYGIPNNYALEIVDLKDELILQIKYRKTHFLSDTAARHLEYYQKILDTVLKDPEIVLDDIDLLSGKEKELLVSTFNNSTDLDYPDQITLHALFEKQAKKTPDQTALDFNGAKMSYRELDQRSHQLANHLQKQGVGPNVLVGVYLERSLEMVVAVLGIVKAGGAYVPIEPAFPEERVSYIVEDSLLKHHRNLNSPMILTQARLKNELLSKLSGASDKMNLIAFEAQWDQNSFISKNKVRLQRKVVPDDMAYVMYTSGSTGRPKGVMVNHSNVVNFLYSMQSLYQLETKDCLVGVTPMIFDIHVLEFFLPLLNGSRLVIASEETAKNPELLSDLISQAGGTIMQATPVTWRMLLATGWKPETDIVALCGGEAMPAELRKALYHSANIQAFNMYGPTETTVWSCTEEIKTPSGNTVGKPIGNTQIYIVNPRNLALQPLGVVGELCIAGSGLARGYLGRPELTEEKFIDHPLAKGKLYRTGDLARWLPTGEIEFFGRIDSQVKIRGFRIELGEIETILNAHEAIQSAAVVVKEHASDKQLVGYVKPADSQLDLDIEALRAYLSKYLPDYMVPTFINPIAEIPLTPSGKVDRKALAAKALTSTTNRGYQPPQNETEQQLAAIWADVLELDHIGTLDNFFEIGGNSLLSIPMKQKIESSFKKAVSIVELFQYPTIQSFARHISGDEKGKLDLSRSKKRMNKRRAALSAP